LLGKSATTNRPPAAPDARAQLVQRAEENVAQIRDSRSIHALGKPPLGAGREEDGMAVRKRDLLEERSAVEQGLDAAVAGAQQA
jgi:hypothetical protein